MNISVILEKIILSNMNFFDMSNIIYLVYNHTLDVEGTTIIRFVLTFLDIQVSGNNSHALDINVISPGPMFFPVQHCERSGPKYYLHVVFISSLMLEKIDCIHFTDTVANATSIEQKCYDKQIN